MQRPVARAAWLLLAGLIASSPAVAAERYGLVITGATGGETYQETYDRWRATLVTTLREKLGVPEETLTVLGEAETGNVKKATRDNVKEALASMRGRMTKEDLLFVVLIGHGTFDGVDAKFNLVGPDLRAAEWNDLLKPLPGRIVVVNTTGASFPFLKALSAQGRIVITATDSAAQRYETIFPEFFVAAFGDAAVDLDKNGRVSIWEAFSAASQRVRQWYEQRGQLSTERPVLDDNGDGVGKEAGAPGPDGALARRIYLDAAVEPATAADPELAELLRRRQTLEGTIEELKANRDSMPPAEYAKQLEELLVELAKVSRRIREKSD